MKTEKVFNIYLLRSLKMVFNNFIFNNMQSKLLYNCHFHSCQPFQLLFLRFEASFERFREQLNRQYKCTASSVQCDRHYFTEFQSQSSIVRHPANWTSHVISSLFFTLSDKMLGAAGRAAGGLVKQAVKAGNVSQILPATSISRKY